MLTAAVEALYWNIANAGAWHELIARAATAPNVPTLITLFARVPRAVRPPVLRQLLTISRGRDRLVSVVLTAESAAALAAGSRPGSSAIALAVAAVSLAVLAPLAYAKRRLGGRLGSAALRGDGALSGIGASTCLLALAGLALYRTLGWWWADRVAALVVAAIAAVEAWRTIRESRDHASQ